MTVRAASATSTSDAQRRAAAPGQRERQHRRPRARLSAERPAQVLAVSDLGDEAASSASAMRRSTARAPRSQAGSAHAPASDRQPRAHAWPPAAAAGLQLAAVDARRARARRAAARAAVAGAVVDDLDLDVARRRSGRHLGAAGAAVLERAAERLLHDAVGGEVDARRQRPRVALDAQRRPAGPAAVARRASDADVARGSAAARAPAPRPRGAARRAAADLGQRLAAGRLDGRERAPARAAGRAATSRRAADAWTTIALSACATTSWSSPGDARALLEHRRLGARRRAPRSTLGACGRAARG